MKRFWDWLAHSSADPTEVAATVKGIVSALIPFIMFILPLLHLNIGIDQLQGSPELVYHVVMQSFAVISGAITGFGILRKFYLTIFPKA